MNRLWTKNITEQGHSHMAWVKDYNSSPWENKPGQSRVPGLETGLLYILLRLGPRGMRYLVKRDISKRQNPINQL